MRSLFCLFSVLSLPALAAGLNDTGVTTCYDGNSLIACTTANTGDSATYPRQDARFGRDAAQQAGKLPAKIGGGAAGFDFTPFDVRGNPLALTGTPPVPSATPACVRDNVTGLIWEGKTPAYKDLTYTWDNANALASVYRNPAVGLCGTSIGWRLPTRRELLSLVHRGTQHPAIDTSYFPNTATSFYWSSDNVNVNTVPPTDLWIVSFIDGTSEPRPKTERFAVRFVRSGS
jgi:hypothetical protein